MSSLLDAAHFNEVVEGTPIDPEDFPLGETIWVARHLDVSFDGRTDTTQTVVLASGIEAEEFVSGVLMIILHAADGWAHKAHLGAQVHAVELDPSEPDVELVGPALAELAVEPPVGVSFAALTMVPSKLRVSLDLFQTVEATGPQTGQISIAIILRRKVPPTYDVLV